MTAPLKIVQKAFSGLHRPAAELRLRIGEGLRARGIDEALVTEDRTMEWRPLRRRMDKDARFTVVRRDREQNPCPG